ncbi:MAG: NlpC/P60 family protein [Eubacteriales bacterium]
MKTEKNKLKNIKLNTIEETLRTTEKVRSVSSKVKENIPGEDRKSMNEYASDNVTEQGSNIAHKASNSIFNTLKNRNEVKQNNDIKKQQAHYGKKETARSTHKNHQQATEIEINKSVDNHERNIRTLDSTISKNIKTKEKGRLKPKQSVLKDINKKIKTSEDLAKRTALNANKKILKIKRSKEMEKRAVKTTAKSIKKVFKSLYSAAKAAAAALKSIISGLAACGWVAIVLIIVVGLIVFLASSPWGIFFNDTDEETPTISELVAQINNEYNREIINIITNAGEIDELIINGDTDNSTFIPYNWVDVLGVYAVKTSANPVNEEYLDVLVMDEKRIKKLKEVFWKMNAIVYVIEEEIIEEESTPTPYPTLTFTPTPYPYYTPILTPEPTPSPDPDVYRKLIITLNGMSYEEGAEEYKFGDNQIKLLNELMSVQYYSLFMEICGMNCFSGLTPEQAANLINNLPSGYLGSTIVEYALSRLGDPYSQPLRGQGSYVDCSYFARWCYQQAGVTSFTAGTAASQAEYCVNNGLTIAKSALQPGDLIFWSFNINGRFMDITHVGIYAGNGYVIDASASNGMVVYREIFGSEYQVCYGRPHVGE